MVINTQYIPYTVSWITGSKTVFWVIKYFNGSLRQSSINSAPVIKTGWQFSFHLHTEVYNECISTSLRWRISFKNKFVLAVNTLGSPGTYLANWEDQSYVPENKASKRVPWNVCRESWHHAIILDAESKIIHWLILDVMNRAVSMTY